MDIVTDLTAETVSYITIFQDILKSKPNISLPSELDKKNVWLDLYVNEALVRDLTIRQKEKIIDLIWHSPTKNDINGLVRKYFERTILLLFWLQGCISADQAVPESIDETRKLVLSKT